MFYAYRITGDTRWQDYVWTAFQNMLELKDSTGQVVPYISNVNVAGGGGFWNYDPAYVTPLMWFREYRNYPKYAC